MNAFLACFLAVIFASIVKDVATRTLAQLWVARQLRRAGVRRVGSPAMPPPSGLMSADPDVHRQMVAFGELHIAALDMAGALERELPDPDALTNLVNAAKELRASLPPLLIKQMRAGREMRRRSTEPVA